MKMRRAHHVPLSRQSVAVLHRLREISGSVGFLFPSIRTHLRPMSENTVNAALRRIGYVGNEMTAHGFRAMASTLLNESGKWSADAIERAFGLPTIAELTGKSAWRWLTGGATISMISRQIVRPSLRQARRSRRTFVITVPRPWDPRSQPLPLRRHKNRMRLSKKPSEFE